VESEWELGTVSKDQIIRLSPTIGLKIGDLFVICVLPGIKRSRPKTSFSNNEDSRPVPLAPPSLSSLRLATELWDLARRTAMPPLKNSDAAKNEQKRQRTNRRTNRERRTQNQQKIDQITMIHSRTLHRPSQGSCRATPRRSWLKPTSISGINRSWPRTRKSPQKRNSKFKPNLWGI